MNRFDFIATTLDSLYLVNRRCLEDSRGFLSRLFCAEEFQKVGLYTPIVQINHTLTKRTGTVRGMHFQYPPHGEFKLVSCLAGKIFDVAVDLRKESPTFLKWHGEILSAENKSSLLIPPGFAHGFQTLSDDCELLYLHTAAYQPEFEGAVNAIDPMLAITWPLTITERSEKDLMYPYKQPDFQGI